MGVGPSGEEEMGHMGSFRCAVEGFGKKWGKMVKFGFSGKKLVNW